MVRRYINFRLGGSFFAALFMTSCGHYDWSGKPAVGQLSAEAKPFVEHFDATVSYHDRVETKVVYIVPRENYIAPSDVDALARAEGWTFVAQDKGIDSYEIKYAKKRFCLNLERTDGKSMLSVSWSSNTISWDYCDIP